LDIPIIIEKLEEAIFGIFRLGWGFAKGVAKKVRTFSKFVVKSIKDLIKGFEELIKFLKGEKGSFKKIIDEVFEASNIKKIGFQGGKILSESEIEDWAKVVMKKFETKLLRVDKFDDPEVLAQFDPNTNTIKYTDEVTEYLMTHESFHAQEMKEIGFAKYTQGGHIENTPWTIENRIHEYKREKYVYEKIQENISKFTQYEDKHSFIYFDTLTAKLEILLKQNNIPFPKN